MIRLHDPAGAVHEVANEIIVEVRQRWFTDEEVGNRVSDLLIAEIWVHSSFGFVSEQQFLREILACERGEHSELGAKSATKLDFPASPLRGLWHKHFILGQFVEENFKKKRNRKSVAGRIKAFLSRCDGIPSCSIPDDHIDPRRSALFMARLLLREVRDGGRRC
ncbi:hypothetical protein JMM59_18975 [Rhodovulum sulfidophilum]|uniref:hypothetical protein n=1 Tax=Rhodovulum sulfidophilum TaxID=35806 RepID=UPI001922F0FF|nr:hypothetical protein [Rhodovulum sulfidophilum]MBL3567079.1 hypothetical protein [Rhodovulum sulfidophilum]